MHWLYDHRVPKSIPPEYFDPNAQGRHGRLLSQKAYNLVRKKQLEYRFAHKHKSKLATLLKPEDYPELQWPVLIGKNNEAVAIMTESLLGEGGYGKVYTGISLDTGLRTRKNQISMR